MADDRHEARRAIAAWKVARYEHRIAASITAALAVHKHKVLSARIQPGTPPPDAFDLGDWPDTVQATVTPAVHSVLSDIVKDVATAAGVGSLGYLLGKTVSPNGQTVSDAITEATAGIVKQATVVGENLANKLTLTISTATNAGQLANSMNSLFNIADVSSSYVARSANFFANALATQAALTVQNEGQAMTKVWTTVGDDRVRLDHQDVDGVSMPVDQPFNVGGDDLMYPGDPNGSEEEIANCVTSGMMAALPDLRAATARWYEGDLVVLHFAFAGDLAVTPNHPILRSDGSWVAARELKEGDHCIGGHLIRHQAGEPDVDHPPAEVGEIYRSAKLASGSERVDAGPFNFHGDIADGEVDVVAVRRPLGIDLIAAGDEQITEFGFAASDVATAGQGRRHRGLHAVGLSRSDNWITPSSLGVRGLGKLPALIGIRPSHARVHAGASIPTFHASSEQPMFNSPAVDAKSLGESEFGLTLEVATDDLLSIDVLTNWAGVVHNFDTGHGWYLSGSDNRDGILSRNCRCWLVFESASGAAAEAPADQEAVAASVTPPPPAVHTLPVWWLGGSRISVAPPPRPPANRLERRAAARRH